MVNLSIFRLAASSVFVLYLLPFVSCGDFGSIKCNNGTWSPDAKLIGTGLSCPIPLDGKESTKGKTMLCGMKKVKAYDGETVQKDKLAPAMCGMFTQEKLAKECKQAVTECLKNSKDYFKDPKTDKEYKSWYPFYACMEKWGKLQCKK